MKAATRRAEEAILKGVLLIHLVSFLEWATNDGQGDSYGGLEVKGKWELCASLSTRRCSVSLMKERAPL